MNVGEWDWTVAGYTEKSKDITTSCSANQMTAYGPQRVVYSLWYSDLYKEYKGEKPNDPGFVSGIMRVCVCLTVREGDLEWLGGVSEVPQRQAAVRVTAHELLPFVMPADRVDGLHRSHRQSQCFSQSHKALQVNHCVMQCHEKEAWLGKRNQESCSRPHTTPSSASGWDQSPPKNWSKFKWTVTTYRTAKPKLHTGEIKLIQKWNVMTHDTDSYSI